MDCLRLDTCKRSSPPPSSSPLFPSVALSSSHWLPFSVAVQWEVTGHSEPRLAAAPLVILWLWLTPRLTPFSLSLLHPPSPPPSPRLDWQLCGCDTCQTKAPRRSRETRTQNKCKWPCCELLVVPCCLPCIYGGNIQSHPYEMSLR